MARQKIVLITGANGGLGKQLVTYYLANQWHVVAVDKEFLPKNQIHDRKSNYQQFICDFTNQQQIADLLCQIKKMSHIDTLILNAAHYSLMPTNQIDLDNLNKTWMINVTAHFQLLQQCQQQALQHCYVIGSDQVFTPFSYNISYSMSKAALMQMVKSFAVEYDQPKILGICPITITDTPMTIQAADALAKLEGKTADQMLQMFAEESPQAKPLDAGQLAQWMFALEKQNTYLSGDIIYVDSQLLEALQ